MPVKAVSDTATFAGNAPSAKQLLEEFANATSLGKACGYREEAIAQYYSKEFARLIRKEAKGPTADQDVDREVGIALVSAKMYANQRTEGRRFTSEQCAMARNAIDESVPRAMTNHNRLKLPMRRRIPVTSKRIRSLAAALLLGSLPMLCWCSDSPSNEPPQIQREVISKNLPQAETSHQRIFVSFEGSPKMTRILQEKLRAKGFAVADDAASADARFKFNGTYIISALAKQDIVGPLARCSNARSSWTTRPPIRITRL